MSYEVNYDDKRFAEVEADKKNAMSDLEKTYSGMINESDGYYQAQIDASKEWEEQQKKNQQEQTDFAIQKIEQDKEQAKKDYTKEQSGAYTDWQKQSNQYGANAEQKAAQGMQNTGYSESSQVSMYNTYQNRVAVARESYNRAVLDFNNAITEARLQNNSALAEIAYNAHKERLELSMQGFQYKNQLLIDQSNKKLEIESLYYNQWRDVLDQINTENALAEEMRQFNEQMAFQKEQAARSSGGGGGGGGGSSRRSSGGKSSGGSGSSGKINKGGSSGGGGDLPSDTATSILNLGQGPISPENLGNQVKEGKVTSFTNPKTGNPYFVNTSQVNSGLLYSKKRF